jgi:hypothetical protein
MIGHYVGTGSSLTVTVICPYGGSLPRMVGGKRPHPPSAKPLAVHRIALLFKSPQTGAPR